MAYGLKYELFFSDLAGRKLKLEIHKKNYEGAASLMVGTGQPVVIKWNGDDDIYSPIIGSTCEINLFVTDDTSYDEFYDSDEREYLVKVLHSDTAGGLTSYNDRDIEWQNTDEIWNSELGVSAYYDVMWSGFIVVDRFSEQMVSKPYPIKLEAIDGLGTLEGFNTPFDSTNTTGTKDLFYYLKEILKLTGHNHNIYISNDIRKTDGNSNETIFHDIVVNEYALFSKKLIDRNAKDVLKEILEITNSRIYHSDGHWYIANNSSLIDNRIDQEDLGASGADVGIEPVDEDPYTITEAPNVVINGGAATDTAYNGGIFDLWGTNSTIGSPLTHYVWTYNGITVNGSGSNPRIRIPATTSLDNIVVTLTGYNDAGSDSDTITLDILADPVTPPDPILYRDGNIKISIENYANKTRVEPTVLTKSYTAAQVENGESVVFNISVVPISGYSFNSVNDIPTIESTKNYTISNKTLTNGVISFDVTAPFANGTHNSILRIYGDPSQQVYVTLLTLNNLVSNSNADTPIQVSKTGIAGSSWTHDFFINANIGYKFDDISRVSASFTGVDQAQRQITKISNSQIRIRVTDTFGFGGKILGLKVTGNSVSDTGATGFASGMSMDTTLQFSGYSTDALPAWILINQNGRGLGFSSVNNTDLFNGEYKINVVYTSGGSGWLCLFKSSSNSSYYQSVTTSGKRNDAVGTLFQKDKYNWAIGCYTENRSYMSRVALVQFQSPNGTVLHQITVTQKSVFS